MATPLSNLTWLDWLPPAAPMARRALHAARIAPEPANLMALAEHLDTIDANRLASFLTQHRLTQKVIPLAEVARMIDLPGALSSPAPEIHAHREIPPLFVSLARALLALGCGGTAWDLLRYGLRPKADADTVRHVEAARLEVIRRMRVKGRADDLLQRKTESNNPPDVTQAWPIFRLLNPLSTALPLKLPTEETSPEVIAAWWEAQTTATPDSRRQMVELKGDRLDDAITGLDRTKWNPVLARLSAARSERILSAIGVYRYPAILESSARLNRPDFKESWQLALCSAAYLGQDAPRDVVEKIPPREVAAWALEVGELLVWRLPQPGQRMLDFARQFFVLGKDPFGVFQAALCSTWADFQRNDLKAAERRLENLVLPAYVELRQTFPWFPASEDLFRSRPPLTEILQSLAEKTDPAPKNLSNLEPFKNQILTSGQRNLEWWLPWLTRFAAARLLAKTHTRSLSDRARWNAWQLVNLRDSALPLETEALKRGTTSHALGSAIRTIRDLMNSLGLLGVSMLTLAALAFLGLLVPAFFGNWLKKGEILSYLFGTTIIVCILLSLVALLVQFNRPLLNKIIGWLASFSSMRLVIHKGDRQNPQLFLQHFTTYRPNRYWMKEALALLWRSGEPSIPAGAEWPVPEGAAPELPFDAVTKELLDWAGLLGNQRIPLPLETDLAAAPAPWEAALLRRLRNADPSAGLPRLDRLAYRPYRRMPERRPVTFNMRKQDTVELLAVPEWYEQFVRNWNGRVKQQPPTDAQILHIIGRAAKPAGGYRMEAETGAEQKMPKTFSTTLGTTSVGTEILQRPSRGLRDLALVIAQGEPAQIDHRLDSDRDQTGRLRAFAAEMLSAGDIAVLVIPSLPPRLAEETTALMAKMLVGTIGLRHLLDLTDALRQCIADWDPWMREAEAAQTPGRRVAIAVPDRTQHFETMLELALEVTLFARARLKRFDTIADQAISDRPIDPPTSN